MAYNPAALTVPPGAAAQLPIGLIPGAGFHNVQWAGATGNGTTDDTTAIAQAMATAAARNLTLVFPGGTYLVQLNTLVLPAGLQVLGWGGVLVAPSGATTGAFLTGNQSTTNCKVRGLGFSAGAEAIVGVALAGSANVTVDDCTAVTCAVFSATAFPAGTAYASVNSGNTCSNLRITNCRGIGAAQNTAAGILVQYTAGAVVSNCIINGYGQGIQWWGGDSNPAVNGAVANQRKCTDISISNCAVSNIGGGGIWGSMGQNVTVSGGTVDTCADVGVDFEGCFDCSATGVGVTNCTNGNCTTFFYSRSIVFSGIASFQASDGGVHFRTNNSAQDTNPVGISLIGGTFRNGSGIGLIDTNGGPVESLKISDLTCVNVKVNATSNNLHYLRISDNDMTFENAAGSAFNAITVSGVTNAGSTDGGKAYVNDNKIISAVAQPAGSWGMSVTCADANTVDTFWIENNKITGMPGDITTVANGANAGISPYFIIGGNHFGAGVYTRTESGAKISRTLFLENYGASGYFPNGIPGSGQWDQGTFIKSNAPVAGGWIGFSCVASGAPGTWKNAGAISA